MKCKIETAEKFETSTGKEYKRVVLIDELGKTNEVSVWPDFPSYEEVQAGNMVEGTILIKGKYKNLVDANRSTTFSKSSNIAVAQQRKETSIEHAQNRTAEMWAKNGGWTLVAYHPAYKGLDQEEVPQIVEDLARAILKMDIRPDPFK